MRFPFRASIAALAVAVTLIAPEVTPDGGAVAAAAQPAGELPADLALVPADATGFVHVRLADLWANDVMSGFRKTWEKAGPKALAELDRQFVPAPSTISRGTVFVTLGENKEPQVVGILAFSAAFDKAKVVKAYLPDAKEEQVNGKTVYRGAQAPIEFYFPDDRHIVLGAAGSLKAYLSKPVAKTGPLASALKLAAAPNKVMVASADLSGLPIPDEAFKDLPTDMRPIFKAKQLTVAVDFGPDSRLDVRATYADQAAAQDAEKAVRALADLGRKELDKLKKELEGKLYDPKIQTPRPLQDLPEAMAAVFGLGALNRLDDTLSDPKLITRNNTELALAVPLPKELLVAVGGFSAVGVGLLLPAVTKVREAAGRMPSSNNLKKIGLAIHNYHNTHGKMPADIVDPKTGKPLLSWRVAILPYIEQENVYRLFKLDEPWDSENNKKASQVMIKTFLAPNATPPANAPWGMTNYRGISGPGAIFDPTAKGGITFLDFTDGTSNTIMVLETDELVPWAKPGDFPFDPKKPLPKIVPPGNQPGFSALFADGSVRFIKSTITEKTLKALFTRNGGEIADPDDDDRPKRPQFKPVEKK